MRFWCRRSSPLRGLILALVLALALGLGLVAAGEARAQAAVTLGCNLEPGPSRAVAGIVDGETLRLDDGVELRLIGALAPRASDVGADESVTQTWPPEIATRNALAALVGGRSVALAFGGRRTDRYGRVLAHVFINRDGEDIWLQGRLVEEGLARAYSLPESDACLKPLLERERLARQVNRGLWAHAAYQVRPADRPTELTRYRNTFQLVRGRVERGRGTRGNLSILELASGERSPAPEGASQRGAFRVVWRREVARHAGLEAPERLADRNVLVRGWIAVRGGPEIEISADGQFELDK